MYTLEDAKALWSSRDNEPPLSDAYTQIRAEELPIMARSQKGLKRNKSATTLPAMSPCTVPHSLSN